MLWVELSWGVLATMWRHSILCSYLKLTRVCPQDWGVPHSMAKSWPGEITGSLSLPEVAFPAAGTLKAYRWDCSVIQSAWWVRWHHGTVPSLTYIWLGCWSGLGKKKKKTFRGGEASQGWARKKKFNVCRPYIWLKGPDPILRKKVRLVLINFGKSPAGLAGIFLFWRKEGKHSFRDPWPTGIMYLSRV